MKTGKSLQMCVIVLLLILLAAGCESTAPTPEPPKQTPSSGESGDDWRDFYVMMQVPPTTLPEESVSLLLEYAVAPDQMPDAPLILDSIAQAEELLGQQFLPNDILTEDCMEGSPYLDVRAADGKLMLVMLHCEYQVADFGQAELEMAMYLGAPPSGEDTVSWSSSYNTHNDRKLTEKTLPGGQVAYIGYDEAQPAKAAAEFQQYNVVYTLELDCEKQANAVRLLKQLLDGFQ